MPSHFKRWIETLRKAQDEITGIPDDYKSRDALIESACSLIESVCREMEGESRVEYVVQKKDAINEARGAAIVAVNTYRRHVDPEGMRERVERDNADLFGDRP